MDLQVLAAVYEALWESLQEELDAGAALDPHGIIGRRLLGLATGIPHLGRVCGPPDAPPRAVYVVRSPRCVEPAVAGVFLSEARALAWVARQPSMDRYEVEPHALEYPQLTNELQRRRAAPRRPGSAGEPCDE